MGVGVYGVFAMKSHGPYARPTFTLNQTMKATFLVMSGVFTVMLAISYPVAVGHGLALVAVGYALGLLVRRRVFDAIADGIVAGSRRAVVGIAAVLG